jgi:hypothetical protein
VRGPLLGIANVSAALEDLRIADAADAYDAQYMDAVFVEVSYRSDPVAHHTDKSVRRS